MDTCPVCKSKFILSEDFSYPICSRFKCNTIIINEEPIQINFVYIDALLSNPALASNKFAKILLNQLREKGFLSTKQLAYIIGNTNPKGYETFQAIVKNRTRKDPLIGDPAVEDKTTESPTPVTRRDTETLRKVENEVVSNLVIVTGDDVLAPTSEFKYGEYPFLEFNPLQSTTIKYVDEDVNIVVSSPTSSGKCLVGNTLVTTTQGIIPLKDCIVGTEIISFDINKLEYATKKVSHFFDLGEQNTIKIELANGVCIEGTPEHPLLIFNGTTYTWKHLCDMEVGEYIVSTSKCLASETVPYQEIPLCSAKINNDWTNTTEGYVLANRELPLKFLSYVTGKTQQAVRMKLWRGYNSKKHRTFNQPSVLTEDLAWLLGCITGDGCLRFKEKIGFSNIDISILEEVKKCISKFNLELTKTKGTECDYSIFSVEFTKFIQSILGTGKSEDKYVPEYIFKSRKSVIIAYLSGLLDTDGHIGVHHAEYTSASKDLIYQIQLLFSFLGIIATITTKIKKYNGKVHYRLFICGNESRKLEVFLKSVKCNYKKNSILDISSSKKITKSIKDIIPLFPIGNFSSYKDTEIEHVYKKGQRSITRNFLQRKLKFFRENTVELTVATSVLQNDLYFLQISSISKSTNTVYDVTVPDTHCFIANGVFSHNTIVAEQFIAAAIHSGKKALYIAPLRALTNEKYDDWNKKDHYFSRYKIEVLTGDFILTPDRVEKINEADIILLTSEMLDSRTRKLTMENNTWLLDTGVMVVDESHLLASDGRGDNLECALVRFSEQNKNAKIIFLSATMPNVQELAAWLSHLNGKNNLLIKSEWRPIELEIHYVNYQDKGTYISQENRKIDETIRLLKEFRTDKFLVFVHTKKTGKRLLERIAYELGEQVEFHSAELQKEKRHELEANFKTGSLRILVATSTLAWGINAPARRVIIVGVTRGMSDVTTMEIIQMVGRSGRYGIDVRGDAYVLLPESTRDEWITRIQTPEDVISRMVSPFVLTFHVISEIVRGIIFNRDSFKVWYLRTLASFQNIDVDVDAHIEEIEETLVSYSALKIEDGVYTPTGLGKVSSWMYYHPLAVFNWYMTMSKFMGKNNNDTTFLEDTFCISTLCIQPKKVYPPSEMTAYVKAYENFLESSLGVKTLNPFHGLVIANMIATSSEKRTYSWLDLKFDFLGSIKSEIKADTERMLSAIQLVDNLYGYWGVPKSKFDSIGTMFTYEVDKTYADICRVKWIGKKMALELRGSGIKKAEDVLNRYNYDTLVNTLGAKKAAEAVKSAEQLVYNISPEVKRRGRKRKT